MSSVKPDRSNGDAGLAKKNASSRSWRRTQVSPTEANAQVLFSDQDDDLPLYSNW